MGFSFIRSVLETLFRKKQRARKKGSFLLLIHRLRRRERFFRFRCLILDAKDEGNFLISPPQGASPPFSVVRLSRKKSNYLCQNASSAGSCCVRKDRARWENEASKRLSSTFQQIPKTAPLNCEHIKKDFLSFFIDNPHCAINSHHTVRHGNVHNFHSSFWHFYFVENVKLSIFLSSDSSHTFPSDSL